MRCWGFPFARRPLDCLACLRACTCCAVQGKAAAAKKKPKWSADSEDEASASGGALALCWLCCAGCPQLAPCSGIAAAEKLCIMLCMAWHIGPCAPPPCRPVKPPACHPNSQLTAPADSESDFEDDWAPKKKAPLKKPAAPKAAAAAAAAPAAPRPAPVPVPVPPPQPAPSNTTSLAWAKKAAGGAKKGGCGGVVCVCVWCMKLLRGEGCV